MADSFVRVPADSTGKRVDASELNVGAETVQRQRIVIADNSATAEYATVTGGALLTTGTFNISAMPTVTVTGGVAISGTAQVAIATPFTINAISATVTVAGNINISATAIIAGRVVISLTAVVAGVVGLTAGTAVIGDLNAISRTVQVAVGTPFTVNNISATVVTSGLAGLTAGTANIGHINHISATVTVAGVVNVSATAAVILAAGTANFGTLNDISRTVQVAVGTPFTVNNISATTAVGLSYVVEATTNSQVKVGDSANAAIRVNVVACSAPSVTHVSLDAGTANIGFINHISATVTTQVVGFTPAIMSASHGPKCVTASTSANVTLIASPGAGANIYVTQLMVGNMSSTLTRARIGTSASTGTVVQPCAASGGGFVLNFDPPWMLSASEACLCSVKPNVSEVYFTVNFFVR